MFRLLFVLLVCLQSVAASGSAAPIKTLSEADLNKGPVALDGIWAFDWQALHIDMKRPMIDGVVLPGLWHKQGPYQTQGYGTFRLVVELPKFQPHYLRIPDAPSALALWVNGEKLFQRGTLAESRAFERPKFGPATVALPPASRYEFILHISNFHHKEGGMWHSLEIADGAHLSELSERTRLLDAMMFAFLISVAFYLLVSHWQKKNRTPAFWFVAFLLAVGVRSVLVGERIAYDFLSASWLVQQRLEHGLMWLALPLFLYYFYSLFKLHRHLALAIYAHGVMVVSTIMLLVVMVTSVQTFSQTGEIFQVLAVLTALYCLITLAVLTIQKVPQSRLFLASFLGFCGLFLHDILYTNMAIQSRPMTQFGLLFFVLMQSYMLWRSRLKEGHLLKFVRHAMDMQSDGLRRLFDQEYKQKSYLHENVFPKATLESKVMTRLNELVSLGEEKRAFRLSDLVRSLRPYFDLLNCQLVIKRRPDNLHSTSMLWVQRSWFEQLLLAMARLSEGQGQGRLVISETEHYILVRLSIRGRSVRSGFDLSFDSGADSIKLNWIYRLVERLGCQLSVRKSDKRVQLFFKYPLQRTPQKQRRETVLAGVDVGPTLLIETQRRDIYEHSLGQYYRLVFASSSSSDVARFRPSLVVMDLSDQLQPESLSVDSIRAQYPSMPILVVLSVYQKAQLSELIRKGVSDYMITPLVQEEVLLKVQALTARKVEPQVSMDQEGTLATQDSRALAVQLTRTCIQYWQTYTGRSKADLAETSKLWRVYLDGSTAKTRTLDKYLSLQSLPKKPRWDTVSRTALYVMEHCGLNEEDRTELDAQLKQLQRQLAS